MSYEQLVGALGRGMFFRPERRRIRDFVSRDADASVLIDGTEHTLFDVSMSGVSFLASKGDDSWRVGARLDITVVLHGRDVHAGAARVARVEHSAQGSRVGLELVSGFLDLIEVRRRDDAARFEGALDGGDDRVHRLIPAAYVEQVSRVGYFLQYYRRALDRHEDMLRQSGASESDILVCTQRVSEALRPRWLELCREASRAASPCLSDPAMLRAAKEYTETTITPLLMDCPMCKRSYGKPLGYPGDYQVMLYYYADSYEGATIFAKVFHKFFVEHPLSNGVRTRSRYVIDLIARQMQQVRPDDRGTPFRITSLGCGPAREVAALTAAHDREQDLAWTLIDQEEEALAVAYRDAKSAIAQSERSHALQCLNVSFAQLLQEPSLMPVAERQHFIFSTGLFDYLRESRAESLISGLYEWLAPGGMLVIGNALGPNEHFWSPEFVLDWTLAYRTRDQMSGLARGIPAEADIEVTVEPGEAYYFLLVRRPT